MHRLLSFLTVTLSAFGCGSRPAPASSVEVDSPDAAPPLDTADETIDAVLEVEPSRDASDASDGLDSRGTPDSVDELGERCEPPVRLSPRRGPSSGGTRVEVVGEDWYIGALWWLATFGEIAVDEIYDGQGPPPCTLIFETPPHAPGEVPVSIFYGGPDPSGGGAPAGTFVFE